MALSGTVRIPISFTLTKDFDVDAGHNAQDSLVTNDSKTITDGVGSLQGNMLWHDKRSLASGASDLLDLAGVLVNAFGDVQTFARVKMIYIKNRSTVNRFRIGGAASNALAGLFVTAADDAIILRALGRFYIDDWGATGYAVTAGTADILRITHLGDTSAAAEYDIVLAGAAT